MGDHVAGEIFFFVFPQQVWIYTLYKMKINYKRLNTYLMLKLQFYVDCLICYIEK